MYIYFLFFLLTYHEHGSRKLVNNLNAVILYSVNIYNNCKMYVDVKMINLEKKMRQLYKCCRTRLYGPHIIALL